MWNIEGKELYVIKQTPRPLLSFTLESRGCKFPLAGRPCVTIGEQQPTKFLRHIDGQLYSPCGATRRENGEALKAVQTLMYPSKYNWLALCLCQGNIPTDLVIRLQVAMFPSKRHRLKEATRSPAVSPPGVVGLLLCRRL